jgi:ubiquinone biosynthesis accessory factor UbiK
MDRMIRQLLEGLPASLQAVKGDLEAHLDRATRAGLKHLDVVAREEFDAQSRVLARSRELVEQLEARVRTLEGKQGIQAR